MGDENDNKLAHQQPSEARRHRLAMGKNEMLAVK